MFIRNVWSFLWPWFMPHIKANSFLDSWKGCETGLLIYLLLSLLEMRLRDREDKVRFFNKCINLKENIKRTYFLHAKIFLLGITICLNFLFFLSLSFFCFSLPFSPCYILYLAQIKTRIVLEEFQNN